MNRPNPRVALDNILAAKSHPDAVERMRRQLSRAWEAGHRDGWTDGVDDANDTRGNRPRSTPNPYGATS